MEDSLSGNLATEGIYLGYLGYLGYWAQWDESNSRIWGFIGGYDGIMEKKMKTTT